MVNTKIVLTLIIIFFFLDYTCLYTAGFICKILSQFNEKTATMVKDSPHKCFIVMLPDDDNTRWHEVIDQRRTTQISTRMEIKLEK